MSSQDDTKGHGSEQRFTPIPEIPAPRRSRAAAWVLVLVAVLSLGNAVRQWLVGHGALPRELAGLWALIALTAAVAAGGAWRRARWALAAAVGWAAVMVVVTVLGTALLYHGRPPVLAVLPGTVLAMLLGWLVARAVWRGLG